MVLGELRSIGDNVPTDDSGEWLVYAIAAGLLVFIAAGGAYRHRKEFWFYDQDNEPRWPEDRR
jgi:hypothetical protein